MALQHEEAGEIQLVGFDALGEQVEAGIDPSGRRHERGEDVEFAAVARAAGRKAADEIARAHQVVDRLGEGGLGHGVLARALPVRHRLGGQTGLGVVARDQLGLARGELRQALDQAARDAAVVLLARAAQQRLVGAFLHEGVLENVKGVGARAALALRSGRWVEMVSMSWSPTV